MDIDNFTFLPPLILFVFGAAFLVVWSFGSRPAIWWAFGLFGHAVAFAGEVVLLSISDHARTMIIDGMFIASYFALGQAITIHFRLPRDMALYGALALTAYGGVGYGVLVADSMRMELFVTDIACALLLLLPLRGLGGLPDKAIDRLLLAIGALAALDIVARTAFFALTAPPDLGFGDYLSSGYSMAAQISAAVAGLVFSLSALAALALDVVDSYREAAETDSLTGLLNRRGFESTLAASASATSGTGVVVTCDIDHFKQINDLHGHAAGDGVIAMVAGMLKANLPDGAAAARFGGEEFVIFLPRSAKADGVDFAETIRAALARTAFGAPGAGVAVTASFGVARMRESDRTIHDAITRADARMYLAKSAGRNKVVAAGELAEPPVGIARPSAA